MNVLQSFKWNVSVVKDLGSNKNPPDRPLQENS